MRNLATAAARPTEEALLKIWVWFAQHKRVRLALIVWAVCTICWSINTAQAVAAEEASDAGTFMLPLGGITDSAGVPLSSYTQLPLDYGGIRHPGRMVRGIIMSLLWGFYAVVMYIIIAFVEFLLGFEWLNWIASPFVLLANALDGVLSQAQLITIGLAVSALVIGFTVLRGRYGSAVVEFVMVCLVVGLAASPVGNPADYLQGESSWLVTSSEYGSEAGRAIIADSDENAGGAVASDETTSVSAELVDMTVREPALMMSFGSTLSDECAATWNDSAKGGADAEKLRKDVLRCDSELKAANETDDGTIFGIYFLNLLAASGLVFLIAVFAFFIIKDAVLALIGAINTVLRAHLAAFPMGRYAFLNAFMQMLVNVIMVAVYIVALTMYLWLVGAVADSVDASSMMLGRLVFGLVVLVMAITFFLMKRKGKSVGEALARAFGRAGIAGEPTRKPTMMQKVGDVGGKAAKTAWKARHLAKFLPTGAAATGAAVGAGLVWKGAQRARRPVPQSRPSRGPQLSSTRTRAAGELASSRAGAAPMAPAPQLPAGPGGSPVSSGTGGPSLTPGSGSAPAAPTPAAGPSPAQKTSQAPAVSPAAGAPAVAAGPEPSASTASPAPAVEAKPASAPKPAPQMNHGRFGNLRVNKDGSTNRVAPVLEGEIHEGPLPPGIRMSRAVTAGRSRSKGRAVQGLVRKAPGNSAGGESR